MGVYFIFVAILFLSFDGGSVAVTGTAFALSGFRLKDGDLSDRLDSNYWTLLVVSNNVAFIVLGEPLKVVGLSDVVRGRSLLSFLNDASKAFEETQEIIVLGKKVDHFIELAKKKE